MPRRRTQELTGQTPMGAPRIPYDQTDPMQQVAAPPPGAVPAGAPDLGSLPTGMPGMGADPGLGAQDPAAGGLLGSLGGGAPPPGGGPDLGGGLPPGGGMDPAAMGADPMAAGGPGGLGAGGTDSLTGNDLAGLATGVDPNQMGDPMDAQMAQMEIALNDPNVPPDQKAQIQQILDLAGRRRLAGLGGPPQAGGLGA